MVDRTEELEIKVAYLEKLVGDLDEVVRHQADQLDRLTRELHEIREELAPERSDEPEVPPHY